MNGFIETLKSVGGVKPCPCDKTLFGDVTGHFDPECKTCHGTGQILDLAPLLAKPNEIETVVYNLIDAWVSLDEINTKEADYHVARLNRNKRWERWEVRLQKLDFHFGQNWRGIGLHVVGPQRAHSLVYEVARQLGGTAAVAIPQGDNCEKETRTDIETNSQGNREMWQEKEPSQAIKGVERMGVGYRLSLPIPPDATVLFVTDRFEHVEINSLLQTLLDREAKTNFIPYVLDLVGQECDWSYPDKNNPWKIISLHQEKP